MSFITQGKTNWEFLLIVVIFAAIVGGGIFWYSARQEIPYQPPEIQGPTEVDETADWQTYKNEEYGFEIKYVTDLSNIGAVILDRKVPSIEVVDNNFFPAGAVDENNCISLSDAPLPTIFTKKLTINGMKFCMGGTYEWDTDSKVILYYNYTTKKDDNYFLFEFDIKALEAPCDFSQANQENCFDRNKAEEFFEDILSTFRFIEEEPYVKVIFPNGGEKLRFEETYEIIWESRGVDKIGIILIDESKGWECQGSRYDIPASAGKCDWEADRVICDAGHKFKIKITSSDGKISDESDAYFSIANPSSLPPSFDFGCETCLAKGYSIPEFPPILKSYPCQCKDPEGNIFVEELERDIDAEKADWSYCGIPDDISGAINSFNCPDWMQDINWDRSYQDDATLKFYFYNALDQENQKAYLSKKTGGIAFMIKNMIEESRWHYYGFNSIKFIYPNREIVTLYINEISVYFEGMGDIRFSPDGQYITFILGVHDGERNSIIDVNTGGDILADYNDFSRKAKGMIYFDLEGVVWSSDSKYVAIDGRFGGGYGADGSESIYIGNMAEGGRLTKIFRVELEYTEGTQEYPRTTKLNFDEDNTNIYFSVETPSKEIKYKYNIPDEELIVIGESPLP